MTTQRTTDPIEAMIARIEKQQQRAERARQAELAKMNSERRQRAEHQLADLFTGIVENILPLRAAEKPEYDSQGQFIELTWILGGHEHQLPPIRLTWRPAIDSYANREDSITCCIHNGGRDYPWPNHVTTDDIPHIFHKARQSYAGWMAKIAKREAEKRQEAIHKLVHGGWSSSFSRADVLPRYEKLCDLDPKRAEQEYLAWKERRIAELTRTYNWDERKDEQFVTDLYNELKLLDLDKAEAALAYWRTAVARHQEREQRKTELAQQLIHLAQQYLDAVDTYSAACAKWVANWTNILWEPWHCWEIRYVPIGNIPHPLYTDEENDLVHEITTLEDATYVASRGPGTHVKKLAYNGQQSDFVIGAFLDAKPIRFEAPATQEPIHYHRRINAGPYWLNIPPFVKQDPEPLPASNPGAFEQFARSEADLPAPDLYQWDMTVEELAKAMTEQVLRDFGHWLNINVD